MPIKVLEYIVIGLEIWQQEPCGRRFVAKCRNKNLAKTIAKLLNEKLIQTTAPDEKQK